MRQNFKAPYNLSLTLRPFYTFRQRKKYFSSLGKKFGTTFFASGIKSRVCQLIWSKAVFSLSFFVPNCAWCTFPNTSSRFFNFRSITQRSRNFQFIFPLFSISVDLRRICPRFDLRAAVKQGRKRHRARFFGIGQPEDVNEPTAAPISWCFRWNKKNKSRITLSVKKLSKEEIQF